MTLRQDNIVKELEAVDWDFSGASTLASSVHSLHWYPGNILPQIPHYLISLLSKVNDVVFDPFCGSGTVGIEAVLLGRKACQIDVCRAAILTTRGKLACLTNPEASNALEKVYQSLFYESGCFSEELGRNGEGSDEELDFWLHSVTLGQLRYIWSAIEEQDEKPVQDILRMIFTDTLFACCSTLSSKTSGGKKRRHHWGWVADNVRPNNPVQHNAIDLFKQKLIQAIRILSLIKSNNQNRALITENDIVLLLEDAKKCSFSPESIDLVVTSPPFLAMTDYTLANRLTYLWMGWPIIEDFEKEIGARRRRNRKNAEQEYLVEMIKAFEMMNKVLKPNGICAISIGASRKFPNVISNLIEEVNCIGFKLIWGPEARTMSRRRVSSRSGNPSNEFLCVWSKK